jgi:hypothetical protein
MTLRGRIFEHLHRTMGYIAVLLAIATLLSGLWAANGPRWMWLTLLVWWLVLALAFVRLQLRGHHVSSYHAIWGPDPMHPGNRRSS